MPLIILYLLGVLFSIAYHNRQLMLCHSDYKSFWKQTKLSEII